MQLFHTLTALRLFSINYFLLTLTNPATISKEKRLIEKFITIEK